MDYLNTVATIKTTNMLYKCPECERLICGYEPIIHRKFCFKTILTTPINEERQTVRRRLPSFNSEDK